MTNLPMFYSAIFALSGRLLYRVYLTAKAISWEHLLPKNGIHQSKRVINRTLLLRLPPARKYILLRKLKMHAFKTSIVKKAYARWTIEITSL